jgi:hypothetical protein
VRHTDFLEVARREERQEGMVAMCAHAGMRLTFPLPTCDNMNRNIIPNLQNVSKTGTTKKL